MSYNGSIRGLGPRGEGSTPSTPTKTRFALIVSMAERHTQAVQNRRTPGSNPGRDTITPCVGTGIRIALKTRVMRVRSPLGRPLVRVTELAQVLR